MSRHVTSVTNERRLQRLLIALEIELLQASDDEIRQAASELGIDPDMKGSIAWIGTLIPKKLRPEEVFNMDEIRRFLRRRLTSSRE